ncbi:hypothetical protein MTO96_050349, partial [Rhipicephalus appendiculatus]
LTTAFLGPRNNVPGFRVVVFHTQPKSRGRIALRSSDPTEYPDIDLRMLEHPDDAKAAAEGMLVAHEFYQSVRCGHEMCKRTMVKELLEAT